MIELDDLQKLYDAFMNLPYGEHLMSPEAQLLFGAFCSAWPAMRDELKRLQEENRALLNRAVATNERLHNLERFYGEEN